MKRPSRELVDAFVAWYQNDPHAKNEDCYAEKISRALLSGLSREQFIEFFFHFAQQGGLVQSGGPRTAPQFRKTIEAKFDEFRAFALEPFSDGFDEVKWLGRTEDFAWFGQGLATIYLNRIDKSRFAIVNDKAVEAVGLLGVKVPSSLGEKYVAVRDAERQLIDWYPEFENLYRTDALSQFLIGEEQGKRWAAELGGSPARTEHRYWIYAPGQQARFWQEFQQDGVMGIGWDAVAEDLSQCGSDDEIQALYERWYGDKATAIVDGGRFGIHATAV